MTQLLLQIIKAIVPVNSAGQIKPTSFCLLCYSVLGFSFLEGH